MSGVNLTFKSDSAEKTIELGKKIGSLLKPGDIIAMEGSLAAGKTTITKGIAASMGAVLLAAGEKGKRYILPHSKVMIHEPLLSGGISGSTSTIRKTAEDMIETKRIINGILAECTGKTIKQIDKATAFDNFMSAQEAIDFGLCDKIITSLELSQLTAKHKI